MSARAEKIQTGRLREESVSKLLLQFSFPAIMAMLVLALYNMVDRIFIGNYPPTGANGLAAIAVSFPFLLVLLAFGLLIGVGGATLYSLRMGERKHEEAERTLGNASFAALTVAVLYVAVTWIFTEPLLRLCGADTTVMPYAVDYMKIIIPFSFFQFQAFVYNNMMRADGSPTIAMAVMLAGAVTNIILDPVFIFGFGWGMEGAAWATVIGQVLTAVLGFVYFRSSRCTHKLQLKKMFPHAAILKRIALLGTPQFFLQLAGGVTLLVLNTMLLKYGRISEYGSTIPISAMGIVMSVQSLMVMPVQGITQGAQPIIGYNFGARLVRRVKKTVLLAAATATVWSLFSFVFTTFFPEPVIRLFTQEEPLIRFGSKALRIVFVTIPIVGFQIVISNYFQAVGKPMKAVFLTLSRQILTLIPAIIAFGALWGVEGVLWAFPFSEVIAATLSAVAIAFEWRRLDRFEKKEV